MSLRLLLPNEGAGDADARLSRNDDGTYTLELKFTPDASRRLVLVQRQIAIDWQEDALPPVEFEIRYQTFPAE